jgi:hypothetical protein
MQVKFNNEVLAGSGPEGTSNFRLNSRTLVQEADFLRAEDGSQFDRKNIRNVVSFRTYKLFADEADAEAWLLERGDTILGRGLVTITCTSANKQIERYLRNAVVKATNGEQIGVTVIIDYEITGGKFRSTP